LRCTLSLILINMLSVYVSGTEHVFNHITAIADGVLFTCLACDPHPISNVRDKLATRFVVGLERGPLRLVRITEELYEW
jgi:hypothetical protein